MGGTGSGRYGGRPTVERCYRLNVDTLIYPDQRLSRGIGQISWRDGFAVNYSWNLSNSLDAWIELRFSVRDYRTGKRHKTEQRVNLVSSQPYFGGRRWWFICPWENWRVRILYLPLGAERFASRRACHLGYASQREAVHDRAIRRARKINLRLGGDGALVGTPPDKPRRMRWSTYARLTKKMTAAEHVADERLSKLIAKWEWRAY